MCTLLESSAWIKYSTFRSESKNVTVSILSDTDLSLNLFAYIIYDIFLKRILCGTEIKWNNVETDSRSIIVEKGWTNDIITSIYDIPDFSFLGTEI